MTSRRRFLTAITSIAGAGLAPQTAAAAQPPTAAPAGGGAWDMTWLDRFKGTHKQVFDAGTFDLTTDTPLRFVANYYDGVRDALGAAPSDVNAAVGIARASFPLNASDALWQTFRVGERWGIKDPATGQPATRNIFLGERSAADPAAVRALQAGGALFWQCNFALRAVAFMLARETSRPLPDVRADLVAGLNPGVVLVATHAMAIGLVQERGFTYAKL